MGMAGQLRAYGSGDASGRGPAWYWQGGLHDAVLTAAALRGPCEDRQGRPARSCLALMLDASHALSEQDVVRLDLYDATVKGGRLRQGGIWLQDELTWADGRYALRVTLGHGQRESPLRVCFGWAEVTRRPACSR